VTLLEIRFVAEVKMELLRSFTERGRPSADPLQWSHHDLGVVMRTGLVEPFRMLAVGEWPEPAKPQAGPYVVQVTAPDGHRATFRGDMDQWWDDRGQLVREIPVVEALFTVAAEASADDEPPHGREPGSGTEGGSS
jgi:hypothetical protein